MNTLVDFSPAITIEKPAATSPRQVVLGLFIIGQLAFLVLHNLLGLYQDAQSRLDPRVIGIVDRILPGYSTKNGHAWMIVDEISTPLRRWAQLTGQDQAWSLFAPDVWHATGFPAVVLIWDYPPTSAHACARPLAMLSATTPLEMAALELAAKQAVSATPPQPEELLLSSNEPANRHHFFRVGEFRIRRYEGNVVLYLTQRKGDDGEKAETEAEARERWRGSIRDHVSENSDHMLAYLKWRLAVWQRKNPDRPTPRQVILVERTYKILPPRHESGELWDGPHTLPLMRWQPGARWQAAYRPIENYNPVTRQFETIQK